MQIKELRSYANVFDEYTELRIQENRNLNISMINGDIAVNRKSSVSGVSARVYKHGVWGFASHPTIADDTIRQTIQSATQSRR